MFKIKIEKLASYLEVNANFMKLDSLVFI